MDERMLTRLAEEAGLILEWFDSEGRQLQLDPEIQQRILPALGFPADNEEEIQESLGRLEQWRNPQTPADLPDLVTAERGKPITLACPVPPATPFTLILESGQRVESAADSDGRIPAIEAMGYHRLQIGDGDFTLAIAPARCFALADACAGNCSQVWGLAAQLYSLRRPGDGGLGDMLALQGLGRSAAEQGANAIAISPTHAMFSADTTRYSPYSPSSRLLLSVLYSSPEDLFGKDRVDAAKASAGLENTLRELEQFDLVDWPRAGVARLEWLRALFDDFSASTATGDIELQRQLEAYRQAGGEVLEDHCRFEALMTIHGTGSWRDWPAPLQDPRSPAVTGFAETYPDEVRFHAFLQWLAAEGFKRVQAELRDAGMAVGIISDLAVGADDAGSQTWSRQKEMLPGLSIGAPPDTFNVHGQDWGLSAFSPHGLVRNGFRSFIDMLRTSFAHAGGLRIDHILGLMRLWLIPHGAGPGQGAYVRYPLEDMLRLVALESWRHRAIVVGEDLGTVAPGFSEKLAAKGILGMKVLWFERDHNASFKPPEAWSTEAMATTSTHDLPTVAGWWAGRDIDWRGSLGLLKPDRTVEAERDDRARDRARLALALGLTEPHCAPESLQAEDMDTSRVLDACAAHLGRVQAPLVLWPVEDVLGLEEQANLPGTQTEHPNWRRRWEPAASELLQTPEVRRRTGILNTARNEDSKHTDDSHKCGKGQPWCP